MSEAQEPVAGAEAAQPNAVTDAAKSAAAGAAPEAPTTSAAVAQLLSQKAAIDAQFAALPAAELVAAAQSIMARPEVTQAIADLQTVGSALPPGETQRQVNNFVQIGRNVPLFLANAAKATPA